ncbi:MAG: hypothetical protein AAF362_00400 [Pseudomonadota bacterium]
MNKYWRWAAFLCLYIVLIMAGMLISHWIAENSEMNLATEGGRQLDWMVLALSSIYVMASALPFVPGAEIGFGMIMVFGARIALLVYVCMVFAMVLAYLAGRFLPISTIAFLFGYLGLVRARDFILEIAAKSPSERLLMIVERSPNRFIPFLVRHRHIAFALALNVPGNSLVGGGGGLSMIAGMSGLFSFWAFLITAMIAIAPIPLAVYLLDHHALFSWSVF